LFFMHVPSKRSKNIVHVDMPIVVYGSFMKAQWNIICKTVSPFSFS
jgi:hypothetical protein